MARRALFTSLADVFRESFYKYANIRYVLLSALISKRAYDVS